MILTYGEVCAFEDVDRTILEYSVDMPTSFNGFCDFWNEFVRKSSRLVIFAPDQLKYILGNSCM